METGLNASACVGKQPIMVAAASTEHPIGCKQQPIGCSDASACVKPGFHPNATHATQAIAFGWKPGFSSCSLDLDRCIVTLGTVLGTAWWAGTLFNCCIIAVGYTPSQQGPVNNHVCGDWRRYNILEILVNVALVHYKTRTLSNRCSWHNKISLL